MSTGTRNPADLLETHHADVLGITYQVVGDVTLAARAVTTIFERLVRNRPSREAERVTLWRFALRILRNYHARGLTIVPIRPPAADWQTALLNRLGRLDPEDRILLLLRYREGLDDRELAAVLGVDRPTARARLAQARRRLLADPGDHALR
jgi:DNA-directed RNA polymerase specialized sigma24 family protein